MGYKSESGNTPLIEQIGSHMPILNNFLEQIKYINIRTWRICAILFINFFFLFSVLVAQISVFTRQ